MPCLRYSKEIPDAYERLLLDAIEGERRLFIRSDELDAAWSLFTPLLKELEEKRIAPELYPYGSRGPVGAHYLAAKYNVRWGDLSAEHYKAWNEDGYIFVIFLLFHFCKFARPRSEIDLREKKDENKAGS
jgi:hypothetical protein